MSSPVQTWWILLCVISGLNILAWVLTARALRRRRPTVAAEVYAARRLQLVLSAGYVFGCAYRSVLPVFDVPRLCLFDTWFSSVIVGRSVATIAELCFVMQWVLLMREVARATGNAMIRSLSSAVLTLIVIAETCSWYSVLTTANIGHVIEESLWTLSVLLVLASLFASRLGRSATMRPLLLALCAGGAGYILFMVAVDVPMYWARWVADEAAGRHYLGLMAGLADASQRWIVSHRWADWKDEIAWMSLYFSVAVWLSIALVHAPALAPVRPRGAARC